MQHLLVLEVRERVLADVAHAHPDREREDERAVHETAAVLALAREVLVDVERVRVHREEREPRVVEVADRPSRPVLDDLADGEILEPTSHGWGAYRDPKATRQAGEPRPPSAIRAACRRERRRRAAARARAVPSAPPLSAPWTACSRRRRASSS